MTEVIKTTDWIVDLGPEGGDAGGYIIAQGTPQEVVRVEGSYTGRFLKGMLFDSGRSISGSRIALRGLPNPRLWPGSGDPGRAKLDLLSITS